MSIEDPFETHACEIADKRCDVASAVTERGMERLEQEWARAAQLLRGPSSSELNLDLSPQPSAEDEVRLVMRQLFGETLDPRLLLDEPSLVKAVGYIPRARDRRPQERDSKGGGKQDSRGEQGWIEGKRRRGRGTQARGRGTKGGRGARGRQRPRVEF